MFKETVKYTDYNGVERTEDVYFNLSKAEIMEMQMGTEGGYAEMLQKIVNAQDAPRLIAIFKELLLKSYGEPSLDGRRFVKTEALREEFSQTEVYSELFMKYATDAEEASKFVNGIMPADLMAEAAKQGAIPQLTK